MEEDDDWYRKNEDGLYCIEITTNRFSDLEFQRIIRTIRENSRHTDRLSISCNKYSIERVKLLVEALEHSRSVSFFSIFESQIDETVVTELCKALEYTPCKIRTLELLRNQIEDCAAKLLVQALKTNTTITKLSLFGNMCRFKLIAPAIKYSTSLRVLRLHSEHLKSEGGKYLADVLKNHRTIEAVQVFRNELPGRSVCQLIEALATVKSLTTLEFDDDQVDDRVCRLFAALLNESGLTSLALTSTSISLTAARTLKKALMKNSVLKSLKLVMFECPKGAKSVLKVVQALKVNTTLERLNISRNPFYLIGSEWTAKLGSYLKSNTTLKSLNIASTRLNTSVQAIADLIRCTSSLTDLNLRHNRMEYAVGNIAAALTDNRSLKRLALGYSGDHAVGSQALAYALRTNTTLQTLDLESCYFEKDIFHALKVNKTLTQLNIRQVFCGDPVFGLLASVLEVNTTLWKVDFSGNGGSWDEAQRINKLLDHNRRRRLRAVELLVAAQVILLPKDRGMFNAMPAELIEMIFRHFQFQDNTMSAHQQDNVISLALDREFLSPDLGYFARFNRFWDIVLQANHNV
jgi:hypothetical protein